LTSRENIRKKYISYIYLTQRIFSQTRNIKQRKKERRNKFLVSFISETRSINKEKLTRHTQKEAKNKDI